MRIFSTFKDYYDTVGGYPQDPAVVYCRKPATLYDIPKKIEAAFKQIPYLRMRYDEVYPVLVGFCGKLYCMWQWAGNYYTGISDVVEELIKSPTRKTYGFSKRKWKQYVEKKCANRIFIGPSFIPKAAESWKSKWDGDHDELFIDFGYPIFIVEKDKRGGLCVRVNCDLKRIRFQRIMPTWQAFQNLSMFMGNQMVDRTKHIPEISDEDLASCKGFDKFSFRKEKKVK